MRRIDAFPFAGTETELLLLECRLTELSDIMDAFVIVEATVNHQDRPKPLNFLEHQDRFAPWKDQIVYIVADELPHVPDGATHAHDPWAREHAQREYIADGLRDLDAQPDDLIFQSDLDEIPSRLAARNVNPRGYQLVQFRQRGHFWAIDWQYPDPPGWQGTVACRVATLDVLAKGRQCGPFTAMRDVRNSRPGIPNAGWHFSWIGGSRELWMAKVSSFCHPEVRDEIVQNADKYFAEGWHCDKHKLIPVDVDETWPRWMQDPANVPAGWYRPR